MSEETIKISDLDVRIRTTDKAGLIEATPEQLLSIAEKIRSTGYTTIVSISAIDYPKDNVLELVIAVTGYELNREYPKILEITVKVPRENPRIPSLTRIWPSAEFQERETYEMFGIVFEGHPNLRHLLLDPEEYKDVYPLRKDFIVKEEPIMLQNAPSKKDDEK